MPDFLTASIVAKFDCKLFNALMASLYVRRFIGAGVVGDEALGALIYRGNKGGTRDTRVSGRENRVGVGVEQRQVVAGLEGVHIRHNQSGGSRGQRTAGCVCKGSGDSWGRLRYLLLLSLCPFSPCALPTSVPNLLSSSQSIAQACLWLPDPAPSSSRAALTPTAAGQNFSAPGPEAGAAQGAWCRVHGRKTEAIGGKGLTGRF